MAAGRATLPQQPLLGCGSGVVRAASPRQPRATQLLLCVGVLARECGPVTRPSPPPLTHTPHLPRRTLSSRSSAAQPLCSFSSSCIWCTLSSSVSACGGQSRGSVSGGGTPGRRGRLHALHAHHASCSSAPSAAHTGCCQPKACIPGRGRCNGRAQPPWELAGGRLPAYSLRSQHAAFDRTSFSSLGLVETWR